MGSAVPFRSEPLSAWNSAAVGLDMANRSTLRISALEVRRIFLWLAWRLLYLDAACIAWLSCGSLCDGSWVGLNTSHEKEKPERVGWVGPSGCTKNCCLEHWLAGARVDRSLSSIAWRNVADVSTGEGFSHTQSAQWHCILCGTRRPETMIRRVDSSAIYSSSTGRRRSCTIQLSTGTLSLLP